MEATPFPLDQPESYFRVQTCYYKRCRQPKSRAIIRNCGCLGPLQFNSDWMHTLVIAVDEVLVGRKEDSEKVKNLSTARTAKIEAKGKDRLEIEFSRKVYLLFRQEGNAVLYTVYTSSNLL